MLALGIAIGVVENGLTFRGISVLGAVRTAELEYLVPVLTAIVGLAVLGIPVAPLQAGAIAVVLAALAIAGRARRRASGDLTGDRLLPGQPCCVT